MKKIQFICLIAALALLLCSCAPAETDSGKYKIVASFTPLYAITLSLTEGAENISVDCMAANSTGCLHDYQLTPSDMKSVESADLFLIGGAGMESSFIDNITETYSDLDIVDLSSGVTIIANGEEENSHLWLSTGNAVKIAENICEALCQRNSQNKDIYTANLESFRSQMTGLHNKYYPDFENAKNKKIITFHESFEYLAQEFGIEVAAVIETEPGNAPDPKTLNELIELAAAGDIAAVFTEPQYPDDTARVISDETGVPVFSLDPIVTGEMTADSFVKAFESDLITLSDAVK